MKRVICFVLALALIGISGQLLAQGKFNLEYQEVKPETEFLFIDSVYVDFTEEEPSDLKGLPKGISDKRAYGQCKVGDKPVVFLLAKDGESTILYVDTDTDD